MKINLDKSDEETFFDYETSEGFYKFERSYFCTIKQRRYFESLSPMQVEFMEFVLKVVPEWATHFAGDLVGGYEFMQAQEIPK
jgi:hypothetical protein